MEASGSKLLCSDLKPRQTWRTWSSSMLTLLKLSCDMFPLTRRQSVECCFPQACTRLLLPLHTIGIHVLFLLFKVWHSSVGLKANFISYHISIRLKVDVSPAWRLTESMLAFNIVQNLIYGYRSWHGWSHKNLNLVYMWNFPAHTHSYTQKRVPFERSEKNAVAIHLIIKIV